MPSDRLTRIALGHWPKLAAQMGENPKAWQASELARRDDARVARLLLRMTRDGADPLVLKLEARPERPAEFAQAMALHIAAQQGVPDGVPKLFAFDAEAQACVMTHVDGVPLVAALREEVADHGALLQRAGAWIAGFHRAGFKEHRIFQPKFTLRYLQTILDEVQSGARAVAERTHFVAAAQSLIARQAEFEGSGTASARTHGDLHMRNILMGEHRVWGIDFAGGNDAPVGHDLARLLVDYATLCADHDRIAPGQVLPPAASEAFFAGYDLVTSEDPSVRLLLRHRVLADWWGLPATARGRSPAQERRFRRLMLLATRVFADN